MNGRGLGHRSPVLLMMLVGWLVLALLALPFAAALGKAARLQDRADRRATMLVPEPVRFRVRL